MAPPFWGGVPAAKARDLAGKMEQLIGLTYHELYSAVEKGKPVIIARCG